MRQVPYYLLIGNGQLAKHIQYYFSLLDLEFTRWDRSQPAFLLEQKLHQVTHVLILISDDAIEPFANQRLLNFTGFLIHFSGSFYSQNIVGVHPLMTFGENLYSLEQYKKIPFILDHNEIQFSKLFPSLPNPSTKLNKIFKAKYHALCVLSGNFSCMLWQKFFSSCEDELGLPKEIIYSYLQQQNSNLMRDYKSALSGPLVRGDNETIIKNIEALQGDPFQEVYRSFVRCYQQITIGERQ